jgi:hypothetical protein
MSELSGPQWCARFPTSTSCDDLLPEFRDKVLAFISAMKRAGAGVSIAATYRPPERAYLMHWCSLIGNTGQDIAAVPPMSGVDIDWSHGGEFGEARAAARAMIKAYAIRYPPSLTSRHTQRRAIDMTIEWSDTLPIRDFNGNLKNVTSLPRTGQNSDLVKVGATFGVIKLVKDPPHWSDDGR